MLLDALGTPFGVPILPDNGVRGTGPPVGVASASGALPFPLSCVPEFGVNSGWEKPGIFSSSNSSSSSIRSDSFKQQPERVGE